MQLSRNTFCYGIAVAPVQFRRGLGHIETPLVLPEIFFAAFSFLDPPLTSLKEFLN